jgi:predicted nuclease of predicted toxin-antitoxin system
VHVRDLGLSGAGDPVVLARATSERRTVLSADTDFGQLLAQSGASRPSVVIFRQDRNRRAADQARLFLGNLDAALLRYLEAGAIVVLEAQRVRVRELPVVGTGE